VHPGKYSVIVVQKYAKSYLYTYSTVIMWAYFDHMYLVKGLADMLRSCVARTTEAEIHLGPVAPTLVSLTVC
jgi:hypothetical protein